MLARVDLGPCHAGAPVQSEAVFASALVNIERTVRPGDRVCPYAVSRIAVAFGPDADAVSPETLGERLAQAVGRGMVGLVRDGRARPSEGRPLSVHQPTPVPTTVVTVDRLLTDGTGTAGRGAGAGSTVCSDRSPERRATAPVLRRRWLVRDSSARRAGYGNRHDDRAPQASQRSVLVIDPDPMSGGVPGLAAQAAWALAERMGFEAEVCALSLEDECAVPLGGGEHTLVVLVVGPEATGGRSSWATCTWRVPAKLARAYRQMGIDVLAVSSGATAGALAGCVEQGASVLFDFNELPSELLALGRDDGPSQRWTSGPGRHGSCSPIGSLLTLTSSERRVLYYLTTGLAAQDIADDLVVSLATVRSHIRSVLRKLEVRSQLAAVALANSSGAIRDRSVHAS